jgi:ABC-type microcin C transport system permease subunit YejB
MAAYILRRILLMVPTLFGIMAVAFVVIQFAPGGPVERVIAQLSGTDVSATARFGGGGGSETGVGQAPDPGRRRRVPLPRRPRPRSGIHPEARAAVRLRQAGA